MSGTAIYHGRSGGWLSAILGAGVREQVAVRQHRALGAPRGARGVEQAGEVVGPADDGLVVGRHAGRQFGDVAVAAPVQHDHGSAAAPGNVARGRRGRGVADDHRGPGVGDEVVQLGGRIGRVERLVHATRLERAEVEQDVFGRFLHLHRHPVAGRDSEFQQRIGIAPRTLGQVAVAEAGSAPGRRQGRRIAGGDELALENVVQIVVLGHSRACRQTRIGVSSIAHRGGRQDAALRTTG